MDDHTDFLSERSKRIDSYESNPELKGAARQFLVESLKAKYSYNFDWLGMPCFQYPQDFLALQEIIWETKPNCIIETGVARGGSLIFYASMLELLGNDGFVVGVDIDIRAHNRERIEAHPLSKRIRLWEGSSVDNRTATQIEKWTDDSRRIMVCLDSNHTHEHVLRELEIYTPMVSPGCYCVVFDTIVEIMPAGYYANRPWDKGDNPKTAVASFLSSLGESERMARDGRPLRMEIDRNLEGKLLLTAADGGYLKRLELGG